MPNRTFAEAQTMPSCFPGCKSDIIVLLAGFDKIFKAFYNNNKSGIIVSRLYSRLTNANRNDLKSYLEQEFIMNTTLPPIEECILGTKLFTIRFMNPDLVFTISKEDGALSCSPTLLAIKQNKRDKARWDAAGMLSDVRHEPPVSLPRNLWSMGWREITEPAAAWILSIRHKETEKTPATGYDIGHWNKAKGDDLDWWARFVKAELHRRFPRSHLA